jgi:hypothetical protein
MTELAGACYHLVSDIVLRLQKQVVASGDFRDQQGGLYRADVTAWAILTLMATGTRPDFFDAARCRLAADQLANGSIGISPIHPQAFWATSVAILAWNESPAHHHYQVRAVQFLLQSTGLHYKKGTIDAIGHDTEIKGWPWVGGTHSWVEPTAMSILALRVTGYGDHTRVKEAVRMLMDRQLPHGGWNVGSTVVFEQEQRPAPESTGAALHALSGLMPRGSVQRSLDYLGKEVTRLHTPISLGWSLLALNSWASLHQMSLV